MSSRRAMWLLGVAAWLFIALFTRTGTSSSHEWSRLGTVESLVERHNFYLEESKFRGTRDKVFRNGHFYSHQPPLLATIVSPVYWLLHRVGGLSLSNSAEVDPGYYLFVLLTNGIAFAATIVILYKTFLVAGADARISVLAAVLLPFGSWLFPYAVVTNNHGISAMLLALAAYVMLSIELVGMTMWCVRVLGAALGLLIAFEVLPIVSFVPAAAIFVWLQRDRLTASHVRNLGACLAAPLVAHAVLNIPITGDVIPAGFHTELFEFEGTTFTAPELTGSIKFTSAAALGHYAGEALFWGKGYFTFAPVLAIGLVVGAVAPWWARARGTHLALLIGAALSLAASLITTNNFGGLAVGFRHATYLAPASFVLLAPVLATRSRWATVLSYAVLTIAAISAVVMWWYAVRQPWADLRLP